MSISNSPSTAPTVEPEATPAPPPASGTPFPDPHSPRPTTGGLHPSSDDAGVKSGAPHAVGQGCASQDIRNGQSEQQSASAPQARNEPGSASGASVTQFLNPNCQKPETCKWARSQASCAACANAVAKARAA